MRSDPAAELLGAVDAGLAEEAMSAECPSCFTSGLLAFFEVTEIPAQSTLLVDSRAEAEALGGASLLLGLCPACGLIVNTRYDPSLVDYSLPTEESQAFSGVFGEYARALADDLVSSFDLAGGLVLEVGSGKGDFLEELVRSGIGRGIGIDPGFLPDRGPQLSNVEFRREWYGPRHTHETGDLVLARHLLEHVPNVGEFLGWLAESTSRTEGAVLFIEVPDTSRILEEGAFWDVYHEHCSYFTEGSLARALERAGLEVRGVELAFDGQYLHATAAVGHDTTGSTDKEDRDEISVVARRAGDFARSARTAMEGWSERIEEVTSGGGEVALWGASSKAVAFIAALGIRPVVVDINPHKQGKWLPGVAVEVLAPDALRAIDPELVIPMNPIYVGEIAADLSAMGLEPKVETVDSLSN